MSASSAAIDYFNRLLAELALDIDQARAELREPSKDPSKLKRLLTLLEKRNRLLRQRNAFVAHG